MWDKIRERLPQKKVHQRWLMGIFVLVVMLLALKQLKHTAPIGEHLSKTFFEVEDTATPDTQEESLATVSAGYTQTQNQLQRLQTHYQQLTQQQQASHQVLQQQLEALRAHVNTLIQPKEATPKADAGDLLTQIDDMDSQGISLAMLPKTSPKKVRSLPYYTIPENATAVHVPLMSALVGRIPSKGQVQDPYPFKLRMNAHLLAANGMTLPEIQGMILSGYAIGDLRLRSVQGWITSVTFIFPDGHIQTIRSDHSGGHFSTENTLGYLSDPYGNPFLPGQLITNAPQAIGTQALLGSVKGLSQLKTGTQSPLFARLFGSAAHQASGGVMQWWQAHAAQGFDAIYVPAGQSVAVNFTQAIAIDYHPDGRRVTYERHRLLTDAFYHNPWE